MPIHFHFRIYMNIKDSGVKNLYMNICVIDRELLIAQITGALASLDINIENLVNKSRDAYAYTMIDTDHEVPQEALEAIGKIDGVIRVRKID